MTEGACDCRHHTRTERADGDGVSPHQRVLPGEARIRVPGKLSVRIMYVGECWCMCACVYI